MTLHLVVGLPGAGKTTRAKELEVGEPALRLTPDDWQRAIFADDGPTRWRSPERVDQRDRVEGLLVGVGLRAARLGVDVVLDLGLWSRDERSALRSIAESLGVRTRVVYLPIDPDEQRRRVAARSEGGVGQLEMSDAELDGWRAQFEVPDEAELSGSDLTPAPPGYPSWAAWACERWPSLELPTPEF